MDEIPARIEDTDSEEEKSHLLAQFVANTGPRAWQEADFLWDELDRWRAFSKGDDQFHKCLKLVVRQMARPWRMRPGSIFTRAPITRGHDERLEDGVLFYLIVRPYCGKLKALARKAGANQDQRKRLMEWLISGQPPGFKDKSQTIVSELNCFIELLIAIVPEEVRRNWVTDDGARWFSPAKRPRTERMAAQIANAVTGVPINDIASQAQGLKPENVRPVPIHWYILGITQAAFPDDRDARLRVRDALIEGVDPGFAERYAARWRKDPVKTRAKAAGKGRGKATPKRTNVTRR